MDALVYTAERTLEFRAEPEPRPGAGEVVVEVDSVGICGSDMHAWAGHDERRPAPLILGHEAAGRIVTGPRTGDRVVVNPLVTCMACADCLAGRSNICAARQIISMPPRPGAFARLVAIPERNLVAVPDDVTFQRAALTEPIACSYHAVRLAAAVSARPLAEQRAVVFGGGAIGLAAALVLADFGCHDIWIAETNAARHACLAQAGDFRVFDPVQGSGPEAGSAGLAIDAFGGDASRAAASRIVRPGGVIAHIGLAGGSAGLDVRRFTLQEVTFIGTYTYTMADFIATADAIFAGRLGALDWFEERPLRDGARAFDDIAGGNVASPKIVLRP